MFTKDEKQRLARARRGLSDKHAECIRLVVMGMSYREAAAVLGCDPQTVTRAMKSLPGKVYREALHEVADMHCVRYASIMSVAEQLNALRAMADGRTVPSPKRRPRSRRSKARKAG